MKPILTIFILLFAAPFLLYFCDPGGSVHPVHSGFVPHGCGPFPSHGPFSLEVEYFEIFGFVYDKDGRRLDRHRVEKTDMFNLQIVLEDRSPWTLALLRKSGEGYGFPAAMACRPPPSYWIETDPLVSVDIFMVDPLAVDTISVSKHLRFLNEREHRYVAYDIFNPPSNRPVISSNSHDLIEYPGTYFTLELLRTEAFPESAYFFGEALFSSGRILESYDTPDFLFQ